MTNSLPSTAPLRIGILGAARIVPNAIIRPTRQIPGAAATAIAARDPEKARSFAQRHNIASVHATYAELIADPDIDAIYNPLPNSLHAEWTIRALEAGKHVLCEKPFAANANEAVEMATVAAHTGKVLMEAFHYRYHPLLSRVLAILQSGEIGSVRHIETTMCVPNTRWWDIRWRYDLAGGALMDVGCYAIHLLRTLAGNEPAVTSANALLRKANIDRSVSADFSFAGEMTGHIDCSMWSSTLLHLGARVVGDKGELSIRNPYLPQMYNLITVRNQLGTRFERAVKIPTYTYQLAAFVNAIKSHSEYPTGPLDSVANMKVIDAVYRAAGLTPRGT